MSHWCSWMREKRIRREGSLEVLGIEELVNVFAHFFIFDSEWLLSVRKSCVLRKRYFCCDCL